MSEVNRIIQDLEFCDSLFDYILTPDDSGLLLGYIEELQQENQKLKEELEASKQYEDYYKDLCDKALKTGGKYISVINEIKEQLKLERKLALSLNKPYTVSVIDKLLDKVKVDENK